MGRPADESKSQSKYRHRTVHCGIHPQFSADVCPWCSHGKTKRSGERKSPLKPAEIARMGAIDSAVLSAIIEKSPSSFGDLSRRASVRLGRPLSPTNAAVSLNRLRTAGKTTLTIARADGKEHGA